MATATNDIDEIRRQMAQIRHHLHKDVKEVVAGAEAVADWRRYIRNYPWVAVGAAVAVGYLIVPKRRRSVPRDVVRQSDLAEVSQLIKQTQEPEPKAEQEKTKRSLIGAAFGMLAPLAWRAAQSYAMGYVEQWIAQQQQQAMATAGPTADARRPQDRPGPGGPRSS